MKLWTIFTVVAATFGLKKDCGGGKECPDSATCCELLNKSYGCCPLENAVCCDDHIHCCPENTKCSTGLCIHNDFKNVSAATYSGSKDVICPGDKYVCPDGSTCCESPDPGVYGCCTLESAVCCKDKIHCCPQNTVCDLVNKTCSGKGYTADMFNSRKNHDLLKKRFIKLSSYINTSITELSVVCPDGSSQCPNGYTCCKLPSGEWGCCPFVNAVCCKDKLHCCPENMKCDTTSSSCSQGNKNISVSLKIPAQRIKKLKGDIICPDGMHCSESMTCCETGGGDFGCCPYLNAVCCEDHSHCCPQNYVCNVKEKRCEAS